MNPDDSDDEFQIPSSDEVARETEAQRNRMAMIPGDFLHSLDIAEAAGRGDWERVLDLVVTSRSSDDGTIADDLARLTNVLLAYVQLFSLPLSPQQIEEARKHVVDGAIRDLDDGSQG